MGQVERVRVRANSWRWSTNFTRLRPAPRTGGLRTPIGDEPEPEPDTGADVGSSI